MINTEKTVYTPAEGAQGVRGPRRACPALVDVPAQPGPRRRRVHLPGRGGCQRDGGDDVTRRVRQFGTRIAGADRGAPRLPWARGVSNWHVSHMSYVERQPNGRRFSHHAVQDKPKPGAWTCGICGRWVIRGMGRWWETWPNR